MRTTIIGAIVFVLAAACSATSSPSPAVRPPVVSSGPKLPPAGTYSSYVFDRGEIADIELPANFELNAAVYDNVAVEACPDADRQFTYEKLNLDEYTNHVVRMDPSLKPVQIYLVKARTSGCGTEPRLHNFQVYVVRQTGAIMAVRGGFSGSTRTLPGSQADFGVQLVAVAKAFEPDCQLRNSTDLRVIDSRVDGPISAAEVPPKAIVGRPSDATTVEAWRENWTLSVCGAHHDVPALLIADDRGGIGVALTVDIADISSEWHAAF